MLVHPMLRFPNHLFGDSAFYTIDISLSVDSHLDVAAFLLRTLFLHVSSWTGESILPVRRTTTKTRQKCLRPMRARLNASIAGKRFMQARGGQNRRRIFSDASAADCSIDIERLCFRL